MCRLVARKNHGCLPMTTRDIAKISGLSRSAVAKLSKLTTWKTVGTGTMQQFSLACGVSLLRLSRQREFWERRGLVYLTKATPAQRRLFDQLVKLLCSRGKRPI
jgi:hypothetical protein